MSWEAWQDTLFSLLYTQHGGSGLSLNMSDLLELDFAQVEAFIERLDAARSKEARAIRSGR